MTLLNCYAGNPRLLKVLVTRESGGVLDIAKAWFTVKKLMEEADLDALITYNTVDDPTRIWLENNGTTTVTVWISIDGDDTVLADGQYFYDVQVLCVAEDDPYTVLYDLLTIVPRVTLALA